MGFKPVYSKKSLRKSAVEDASSVCGTICLQVTAQLLSVFYMPDFRVTLVMNKKLFPLLKRRSCTYIIKCSSFADRVG